MYFCAGADGASAPARPAFGEARGAAEISAEDFLFAGDHHSQVIDLLAAVLKRSASSLSKEFPITELARYVAVMKRDFALATIAFTRARISRRRVEEIVAQHVAIQPGIVSVRPFRALANEMGVKVARGICADFMIQIDEPAHES